VSASSIYGAAPALREYNDVNDVQAPLSAHVYGSATATEQLTRNHYDAVSPL
jgi:hypothetical protein